MFVTYTQKAENFYKFSRSYTVQCTLSFVMHTQTHFRPEARENYYTKRYSSNTKKHVRKRSYSTDVEELGESGGTDSSRQQKDLKQ